MGGFSQCASPNSFTHCDQETFLYCVFGKHFIHPLLSICFKEAAPVSERAEGEWGCSALGTGPGERVQGVRMPPQTACSVRKVPGLGRRRGSVWPASRGGVAAGGRRAGCGGDGPGSHGLSRKLGLCPAGQRGQPHPSWEAGQLPRELI